MEQRINPKLELNENYPQQYRIVAILRAPEDATIESAKEVLRIFFRGLVIESVERVK